MMTSAFSALHGLACALTCGTVVLTAACIARRYVSKATAGSSKSAGDRLFFFLNGRPIDLPKVRKLCNTQQCTGGTYFAYHFRCHTSMHVLTGQQSCDGYLSLAVKCRNRALPPCCHPGPEAPSAQARAPTAHVCTLVCVTACPCCFTSRVCWCWAC